MHSNKISRRSFIKITLSAIGIGGISVYGTTALDYENLIKTCLQRLVGEYHMADRHMKNFSKDFVHSYGRKKLYILLAYNQTALFDRFTDRFFLLRKHRVNKFERKLVTDFLTSTNYLQIGNPSLDPIEYYGMNIPCNNPFARFDDPPCTEKA